ncbi:hypothetical protein [Zhaonella formicivorans]|uniref:hypothetical protein n=1 Tax=Zhaonella formicivorans TaxID=2528593 RepID=UPI0010E814C6|nr:hypothetical protein [Zhaonella formicivorans]
MGGTWRHPAGYYSVNLGTNWEVNPVIFAEASQGAGPSTIIRFVAETEGYKAQVQHYPSNGLPDEVLKRALAGPLMAAGLLFDWQVENLAGNKLYYAGVDINGNTVVTAFIRHGDITFGIDVYNNWEMDLEKLKKLAETIAGSIHTRHKLGADPTNGNSYLLGQWTADWGQYSQGLYVHNSFGVSKSWAFHPDGTLEYYEATSFTFYGSGDYGGAENATRAVAFYRVLDDILYIYADAVILAPFFFSDGKMQLGIEQLVKVN